jgi:hypothetical protein
MELASRDSVLGGMYPLLGHKFVLLRDEYSDDALASIFVTRPGWFRIYERAVEGARTPRFLWSSRVTLRPWCHTCLASLAWIRRLTSESLSPQLVDANSRGAAAWYCNWISVACFR